MYFNKNFQKFCRDRNIKDSTMKGYVSSLKKYEEFCGKPIDDLLNEALKEESKMIPLKDRKLKKRLVDFRTHLLNSDMSPNTVKTYFSKLKTFYLHFEVELPHLPDVKYDTEYKTNYKDLPTKKDLKKAIEVSALDMKAVILFMSSSGTAKAETLSLTVGDFINATSDYHKGGSISDVLDQLDERKDIVPTFYLRRFKTSKYYYTFCSPEASYHIVRYLQTRKNITLDSKLFDFSHSLLLTRFQELNDDMKWGFKGCYRFFRSHVLRKFHASNIGLSAEYIDSLQGRSKSEVHETYIKTNPEELKKIYMGAMKNIFIFENPEDKHVTNEYTIVINVFLSGKEYNITI